MIDFSCSDSSILRANLNIFFFIRFDDPTTIQVKWNLHYLFLTIFRDLFFVADLRMLIELTDSPRFDPEPIYPLKKTSYIW